MPVCYVEADMARRSCTLTYGCIFVAVLLRDKATGDPGVVTLGPGIQ